MEHSDHSKFPVGLDGQRQDHKLARRPSGHSWPWRLASFGRHGTPGQHIKPRGEKGCWVEGWRHHCYLRLWSSLLVNCFRIGWGGRTWLTSLEINGLPSFYMRKRRIMNKRKNRRWECNLAQTRSVKTGVEKVVTFFKLSAIKQWNRIQSISNKFFILTSMAPSHRSSS